MDRRILIASLLAAPALLATQKTQAQDPERGRLLYETHCIGCHTPSVNKRRNRVAKSWDEVRAQVQRWQRNQSLGWSAADIDSVTSYLDRTYYKFKSPDLSRRIPPVPGAPAKQDAR